MPPGRRELCERVVLLVMDSNHAFPAPFFFCSPVHFYAIINNRANIHNIIRHTIISTIEYITAHSDMPLHAFIHPYSFGALLSILYFTSKCPFNWYINKPSTLLSITISIPKLPSAYPWIGSRASKLISVYSSTALIIPVIIPSS